MRYKAFVVFLVKIFQFFSAEFSVLTQVEIAACGNAFEFLNTEWEFVCNICAG